MVRFIVSQTVARKFYLGLTVSLAAVLMSACGKQSSFSLLSDQAQFQQNSASTNGKIDVLWVIDNSGSMATSQSAVANNFARFIEKFTAKNFDFRLAVTATDSYKTLFGGNASLARFRDGDPTASPNPIHTGVFVLDPLTPNLSTTFLNNVKLGIFGSGDERAFQSFKVALDNPANSDFRRADAFLSVIIVSDEDDFSNDFAGTIDSTTVNPYTNPKLHSVQSYIDYLDQKAGATASNRSTKYNVNAITVTDQACLDILNHDVNGRRIGHRYIEMAESTGGITGSLCGDFGSTLSDISNKIIELTTQFYLDRVPNQNTLGASIDGVTVPRLASTDPQPWNGYIYHAETNSITFHGSFVPGPGAVIKVSFDPNSLQ
jgi:hypothetical protein